jgi:hypothetical protein
MADGNRAYRAGGINTRDLRDVRDFRENQLAGGQWNPPAPSNEAGGGDMLAFINNMYGQMQQGKQNQLENVLKAAQMQNTVEDSRARLQLAREQEARENLNAQLARDLSQKGEARAQGEYEREPGEKAATRQQALNVASIGAIPSLSDATRGSLRLLNPDYAQREDAEKVLQRDKQLQVTRQALKAADSPKKKKDIVNSITDPDLKTQLLSELEQEGKKVGGAGTPSEQPSAFQQLNSPQGMPIPYPDVGRAIRALMPTAPKLTVDPELRSTDPRLLEMIRKRQGGI